MIDEVGFYALDKVSSANHTYLLTVLKEEVHTRKTKVLFSKIGQNAAFDSITDEDLEDIQTLAHDLMIPHNAPFVQ